MRYFWLGLDAQGVLVRVGNSLYYDADVCKSGARVNCLAADRVKQVNIYSINDFGAIGLFNVGTVTRAEVTIKWD